MSDREKVDIFFVCVRVFVYRIVYPQRFGFSLEKFSTKAETFFDEL